MCKILNWIELAQTRIEKQRIIFVRKDGTQTDGFDITKGIYLFSFRSDFRMGIIILGPAKEICESKLSIFSELERVIFFDEFGYFFDVTSYLEVQKGTGGGVLHEEHYCLVFKGILKQKKGESDIAHMQSHRLYPENKIVFYFKNNSE